MRDECIKYFVKDSLLPFLAASDGRHSLARAHARRSQRRRALDRCETSLRTVCARTSSVRSSCSACRCPAPRPRFSAGSRATACTRAAALSPRAHGAARGPHTPRGQASVGSAPGAPRARAGSGSAPPRARAGPRASAPGAMPAPGGGRTRPPAPPGTARRHAPPPPCTPAAARRVKARPRGARRGVRLRGTPPGQRRPRRAPGRPARWRAPAVARPAQPRARPGARRHSAARAGRGH